MLLFLFALIVPRFGGLFFFLEVDFLELVFFGFFFEDVFFAELFFLELLLDFDVFYVPDDFLALFFPDFLVDFFLLFAITIITRSLVAFISFLPFLVNHFGLKKMIIKRKRASLDSFI